MSEAVQMKLVSSRFGRIVLHLAAFAADRKFAWHAKGIVRELKFV